MNVPGDPRPAAAPPAIVTRAMTRPGVHVAMSLGILVLDLLTGKYLLFPILFVIPVVLSAWSGYPRLASSLAVLLPVGRLAIATLVERPLPAEFALANASVRIAVLLLIAFLVGRVAKLNARLRLRVETFVTVCAWSRTVEYQGEWLSFEQYLERRFQLRITHGISPVEAERALAELQQREP